MGTPTKKLNLRFSRLSWYHFKVLGGEIKLKPGKYIVAVSGGVDSMALLHILAKRQEPKAKSQLVVAHFNHGIRPESGLDEQLVQKMALNYGLPVEVGYGYLGAGASEEKARKARYSFLYKIKKKHQADFIVTAHHQDDLLETAILNILRGTGRRGLSAISDNKEVLRPLLAYPKSEIIKYAQLNKLKWREDSTNQDDRYLRNYLRNNIISSLTVVQKKELLKNIEKVAKTNKLTKPIIATISHYIEPNKKIDRQKFTALPPEIANELVVYWLIAEKYRHYDKKLINRLCIALKTAQPETRQDVTTDLKLIIEKKFAWFSRESTTGLI